MMGQAAGHKNSYIQYYPRFVSYLLKVSAQGCAFSAREQCSPKFLEPNRKKTLKFWTHDRTLTREQREIQTCITQQCCVDHDQSLHGIATHHEWAFVGGPTTTTNISKMADGGHIEFRKMLISPYSTG